MSSLLPQIGNVPAAPALKPSGSGLLPTIGAPPPAIPPAQTTSHSGGSLLGNLAHDISQTVTGTGEAVGKLAVNLVENPTKTVAATPSFVKKSAVQFVKSEAPFWVPVAKGTAQAIEKYPTLVKDTVTGQSWPASITAENEQAYKAFHADPLGPLLDVAALFTGGAARVGALGSLESGATAGDVAQAVLRGHTAGDLRTISVKAGHDNPATVVTRTLPRNAAQAARMQGTDALLKKLPAETPVVGEFARAGRALRKSSTEVQLKGMAVPELTDYMKARAKLNRWQSAAAQMLVKLPLPVDLQKHILDLKALGTKDALDQAKVLTNPNFVKEYLTPSKATLDAVKSGRVLSKLREKNLAAAGTDLEDLKNAPYRHTRLVRGATATEKGLVGGGPVDELKAEIKDAGRPEPYYIPDVIDAKGPLTRFMNASKGLTPPANDLHVWQGSLFRQGLLALHPDLIRPAYIRSVVHNFGLDLHDHVKEVATPVEKGAGLPRGYVWVREKRGQRIPFTETNAGEHRFNVGKAFPEVHDEIGDLTTESTADEIAQDAKGRRLAVPRQLADSLKVEQRRAATFKRLIWDNPTQVWRALVLNLRVPWLENNILGNHFLLAVRFAGIDGLRGYVNALRETKGIKAVTKLLRLPETQRALTQDEIRQVFPEQSRAGTYIGTQLPTGLLARAPKVVRKTLGVPGAVVGALPKIDRATEGFLRHVGVNTALSPEARRVYVQMPKQTRDWHTAYLQAAVNPDVQRLVTKQVNDALGDFLSMTPLEQNTLRAVVPFYAWYREITRIALKLPLDAPGRTDLISKLAQAQPAQQNLPSYLRGDVPTGPLSAGGLQTLVALNSTNPYTTPIQLAKGLQLLWSPNKTAGSDVSGLLNPFLALIGGVIVQASSGDANAQSALQAFYQQFASNLPEVKIIKNPPSPLYPGRTRGDLAKQFLGDPRRRIDTNVASQYASEGQ